MKINVGSVVKANAGRDDGGFFVVIATEKSYCFIADGKSRKLSNPKRKNMKHVSSTDSMIDINDITDKQLRIKLRELSGTE
ncbi:MAG: KOW domain-containing RNA-binding protein [Clostridiales bacterium]|nr:KOW domain-containing RNA-binding protein [Clostridiales bacterium]